MDIGFGLSTGIILFVSTILIAFLYLDKKFRYWKNQNVKSPSLLEYAMSISDSLTKPFHVTQVKGYEKYGRLYGYYAGTTPQLFLAEPELLKQILVKDFPIFRNRLILEFGEPILDKMLSILCNEDWKRVRTVMSPTFSSSRMRKMALLIEECATNFTKHLKNKADEEVDIKRYFGLYALDVIAITAFATKPNVINNPNHEFATNARMFSNRNVPIIFTLLFLLAPWLFRFIRFEILPRSAINYFKNVALHILNEREKSKERGNDFLQLMIDAQKGTLEKTSEDLEENEAILDNEVLPKHKTMSKDEIISQCILFFNAGHDTTANTLSFLSYNLALNPECQEKLLKEIDETWEKNNEVNFDTLTKMPYLEAVLSETLRITPIGNILMRTAIEDYKLGDTGITITKGMRIVVPIYAMHHDSDWFPNPEKFDPDRFLPPNKDSIPPYVYMPFGEGPRNCIGMRFVLMVMKMCIVYLLRDVKFVATETTKKPLEFFTGAGILSPKNIIVKLEKRK